MKYAIAVDIGGTNTRVALVDEDLKIIERANFSTNTNDSKKALEDIAECIKQFNKEVIGVGMSCPGPLDIKNGKIIVPPNLGETWHNFYVAKELEKLVNVPVYLDNDANLAALAEAVVGGGKEYDYVQYLTISTGLGAGFVINKEIFYGSKGYANEVANCVMINNGPTHGRIVPGGLEAISSGTAITHRAKNKGLDVNHAGEVNDLAVSGNEIAKEIIDDAKLYLANFLGFIQAFADPEVFVLGGPVALKIPGFVEDVEALVKQRVFDVVKDNIIVKKAELGDDSGLIGAAYLAFSKMK